MKTITAFAIRTTVGGVHYDALYLDPPSQDVLDAKLAAEHAAHGETDANGDDRWVRAQEIGLIVDEAKHPWAKDIPVFMSEADKAAEAAKLKTTDESDDADGEAHAPRAKVSGSGTVKNK